MSLHPRVSCNPAKACNKNCHGYRRNPCNLRRRFKSEKTEGFRVDNVRRITRLDNDRQGKSEFVIFFCCCCCCDRCFFCVCVCFYSSLFFFFSLSCFLYICLYPFLSLFPSPSLSISVRLVYLSCSVICLSSNLYPRHPTSCNTAFKFSLDKRTTFYLKKSVRV